MASSLYYGASPDVNGSRYSSIDGVVALMYKLTINGLKDVLRSEGLPLSGLKAALQARVVQHLKSLSDAGDTAGVTRVRNLIIDPSGRNSPYSSPSRPSNQTPPHNYYTPTYTPNQTAHGRSRPTMRLDFKESPFYTIKETLAGPSELRVRETTRDTIDFKIVLNEPQTRELEQSPNSRVVVFSAAEPAGGFQSAGKVDIAFPHNVELKVNLDAYTKNLRGLKNKPGTTKPADITDMLRKRSGYVNSATVTYALTKQRYFLIVYMVQKHQPSELVEKLRNSGREVSKEQVVREMKAKASDADIEATSTVMSLKCPLSMSRITVPCRSVTCHHNRCFDAAAYLGMQDTASTWTCPICDRAARFKDLLIDNYVLDILRTTSSSIEQVVIEPDGSWNTETNTRTPSKAEQNHNNSSFVDDDDDLVEITDTRQQGLGNGGLQTPSSVANATMSRAENGYKSTPSKRPASAIIDLTLSDDDDAPPTKIRKQSQPANSPIMTPGTNSTTRPNDSNGVSDCSPY